jgi:AcrR family transcriptional regulator
MDRRTRKTRKILAQAFIDLLQVHDFYAITIRDITEQADVAYSTFFRNFDSKEALLLCYLQEFLSDLGDDLKRLSFTPFHEQFSHMAYKLFEAVHDCPNIYRILYGSPEAQSALKSFKSELIKMNLALLKSADFQLHAEMPPVDLIVENIINQLFGMVEWWIDNQLQLSPRRLSIYFETMAIKPIWA